VRGRGGELFRKPTGTGDVTLSADGSQLAFLVGEPKHAIRIASLAGALVREIQVPGRAELQSLVWDDTHHGFITTSNGAGNVVMFVPMTGSPHVMQQEDFYYNWAIPSPDGTHVAIAAYNGRANAWMTDLP
jgi:hypothetical protein